jgi:hypothetical protein
MTFGIIGAPVSVDIHMDAELIEETALPLALATGT